VTPRKKRAKPAPAKRAKKAKRKPKTLAGRFAELEAGVGDRLCFHSKRADSIDVAVGALERQRQKHAEELARLASKIAEADGRTASLEATIARMYEDHRVLTKNAGTFAARVGGIEQRLGAVASQRSSDGTTIEGISDRVAKLEQAPGGFGELERRVASLESRVWHPAIAPEKTSAGDLPQGFGGAAVQAIEALGGMHDEIEKRVGQIEAKIETLVEADEDLEGASRAYDRRLASLERHEGAIADDMAAASDRIAKLEAFAESTRADLRARELHTDAVRREAFNMQAKALSVIDEGLSDAADEAKQIEFRVAALERSDNVIVNDMAGVETRLGRMERASVPPVPFKGEHAGSFEFKNGAKVEGSEVPGPARSEDADYFDEIVRIRHENAELRGRLEALFVTNAALEKEIDGANASADANPAVRGTGEP